MGRRAKYYTLADKVAAANDRRLLVSQAQSYRSSISAKNHTAYKRRHGRQGSATPYLPKLPQRLVSLALLPLPDPTSYFFAQAHSSAENLDESDLGKWDSEPPYPATLVAMDPPGEVYTQRLVEVMHGRRLRQQGECDQARNEQCVGMSSEKRREVIACELKTALEQWRRLDGLLSEYRGSDREVLMANHLLQWQARTICHLRDQWELLR